MINILSIQVTKVVVMMLGCWYVDVKVFWVSFNISIYGFLFFPGKQKKRSQILDINMSFMKVYGLHHRQLMP